MTDQIGGQTRRGISWSLLGAVTTNVTRVAVVAVLGRTLTSADFGVVAAAVSVNVIVYSIRDIGLGQALVQRKAIDDEHIRTTFAASTLLGLVLAAALFLCAPAIAGVYGIPDSVDLIRVLALIFFGLRGVAVTSRMLAQRAMNFRLITMIEAAAFALGSLTSIACAVGGMGPWSLVAGYFVEEVINMVLFRHLIPPLVGFRIDRRRLRELLSFGASQTAIQCTNTVALYGDNFVVGNVLGATQLGYYSRAYDLIRMPSMVFDAIVGNVLFAAFSRMQDDRAGLAESFRRVAFVNALVLLPMTAALIVLAPDAIHVLMGPGWGDMVLPFRILAVTILLRTNLKLGGILAQAAGAIHAVAIAYIIYMVIVVGGALITIRWGTAGVAVSTAIAITTVSVHCCLLGTRVSGLPVHVFFASHMPGLVVACVVGALTLPAATALHGAGWHPALVFATVGAFSVAVSLLAVGVGFKLGRGEFPWLRGELGRILRR